MRITATELAEAATLCRAATSLAARARVERAGELSLTQVAVLGRIATQGPVTPREVGDQLLMLPQSLSRPLGALERLGLVRRTPDPSDGRSALLEITEAGRTALRDEMVPRHAWVAEAMAAVCTDADRQTLQAAADLMRRMVEHGGGVAPVEP
jgi:DNA-binding MarR family transcriptional regulator